MPASEPPELLRRALDRRRGRSRYQCRSLRHRVRIWWLARLPAVELERQLHRLQVRLDPPPFARQCSCESAGASDAG